MRENKFPIVDVIKPQHVLVSVFDKSNLDVLVDGLVEFNPEIMFYSTGGTGKRVKEVLGDRASENYTSIEDFTKLPEMEGGLVKTLHPKIHAGILAERNNPEHERYLTEVMIELTESPGAYFDLLVCNTYPFSEVVKSEDCTPEKARMNIDIGGPTMIRAACKNYPSICTLVTPAHYKIFVEGLKNNDGISLKTRFDYMTVALDTLAEDASEVSSYFNKADFEEINQG